MPVPIAKMTVKQLRNRIAFSLERLEEERVKLETLCAELAARQKKKAND